MRCVIARVSDYGRSPAPCEHVFSAEAENTWVERRAGMPDVKKEPSLIWWRDFDTLDDLLTFVREQGECIIGQYGPSEHLIIPPELLGDVFHIAIYDGYNE